MYHMILGRTPQIFLNHIVFGFLGLLAHGATDEVAGAQMFIVSVPEAGSTKSRCGQGGFLLRAGSVNVVQASLPG